VIAAQHHAHFAVVARAEVGRRVRANAIEIDGGVTGRVQRAEAAERLFEEECGVRASGGAAQSREERDS
jgi:hypothetical protein